MRSFFLVACLLFSQIQVFGTAQTADWLIHASRFFRIAENPLDTFPWPDDKRPWFEIAPGVMSTGNYRGYLAIWEIRGDHLYLAGIDAWMEKPENERHKFDEKDERTWSWNPNDDKERVSLEKAFPTRFKDGRVFADWFTGTLRIPDGKLLKYIHAGYASISERDILLYFESGVLRRSEIRQNKLPPDAEKSEPASATKSGTGS